MRIELAKLSGVAGMSGSGLYLPYLTPARTRVERNRPTPASPDTPDRPRTGRQEVFSPAGPESLNIYLRTRSGLAP